MEQIIPASQVKIGDSIRFSLKGYFFNSNPEWREQCERTLRVKHISPTPGGKFEFYFEEGAIYRGIDSGTEVILVHRSSPEGVDNER